MGYDINYYNSDKAQKRESFFSEKPLFYDKGIDTNKIFFDYILDSFSEINSQPIKILDLGTGTGYVPRTLVQLSDKNFEIIGVDLSEQMLDLAKKETSDKRVNYVLADNKKLPFEDGFFDIVTNKLTTQFDFNEMNRVLKTGGYFIFKEYDKAKGFRDIYDLFIDRYVKLKRTPEDYVQELSRINFKEIILRKFLIKREYAISEIKSIFDMANIIDKFSSKDLQTIKDTLGEEINITSDPFIIYAQK